MEQNAVGWGGSESSGGEDRMEIACPIYGDDLVFCGESEEDLKAMVGRFKKRLI